MTLGVEIRHRFERFELDVRFEAGSGLTALLGPSGAGKTRTLDAIAGHVRANASRVTLDGQVLSDTSASIWVPPHARRIGYVFQESRLFPHLTVRQNLLYGAWFNRAPNASGHRTTADDVIALLDLGALLARRPFRLSGGERRRVALGRVLLSRPRLLLLDEPLGSLDVEKRQEILPYLDRLIGELRLPTIYVTHDWGEIEDRAETILHMEKGQIRRGQGAEGKGQR